MNYINDKDIHTIVNEVKRPFQFVSMLEYAKEEKHCEGCVHCVKKTKLIDAYNEPYFVCELLDKTIDWPGRDDRPSDCPLEIK